MRKKSKKKTNSFFTKACLILNLLIASFLLLSYVASEVNPRTFWPIAFFGLAYPWLLLLNVLFSFLWLFKRAVYSLISIIAILIGYNLVASTIGFRESAAIGVPKSSSNFIRIMTFNVHYFKRFDSDNDRVTKDNMLDLIRREQPDVICIQEFFTRRKGEFNQIKSLKNILQTEHYYFEPSIGNDYESQGLAIFSKYPIKKTGLLLFKNAARGNEAIYADLKMLNRTVRVYNVHLQSINFQPEDYKYLKKVKDEITNVESSRRIGSRLKRAFTKRSTQAEELKNHAETCKIPYVIAGDFNDTPASYAVNTISKGLVNSFREKGSGFGITYNGDFPNFQIDYILTTPNFRVKSYRIIDKKISDHYAVRSDLELKLD